jgi:hypothetical protein
MSDLIDFVEKLVVPHEKTASGLELEAFDALLAQADEEEKVAYGMMGGGSDDWLSRFQHTPLYEKAIALKEKDLALEKRRMEERQRREKAYRHDDSTWNERDRLCLEKDKLTLELHKWRASQEAKTKLKMAAGLKVAGNGDPLREKMKRLGQTKKADLEKVAVSAKWVEQRVSRGMAQRLGSSAADLAESAVSHGPYAHIRAGGKDVHLTGPSALAVLHGAEAAKEFSKSRAAGRAYVSALSKAHPSVGRAHPEPFLPQKPVSS